MARHNHIHFSYNRKTTRPLVEKTNKKQEKTLPLVLTKLEYRSQVKFQTLILIVHFVW